MKGFGKRRLGLRALVASAAIVVTGLIATATPAQADTTHCSGSSFSACINAGYTAHGYENHYTASYWNAYAGHNCTNYVGYMLTLNGDAGHGVAMGDGGSWDDTISAHPEWGYTVNNTPAVGSIAQWDPNTGMGSSGHVAYVEAVNGDTITVSEDIYSAGPFRWRTITKTGTWPTHFLHIKDVVTSTGAGPDELFWFEKDRGVALLGMNSARSGFTKFWTQTGYAPPLWAGTGDMNGDGNEDLLWYESNSTVSVVTENSARSGLSVLFRQANYGRPTWAGVGDINGDGRDDLVWYEPNGNVSVVTMNGSRTGFNLLFRQTGYGPPIWAGVGDINGDGRDDLLWYEANSTLSVVTMNGGRTGFDVLFRQPGYAKPTWAGTANVNGAGPDELFWYEKDKGVALLGMNSARSGFTKFWTQTGYAPPVWAGTGDINGDSHDDLLWYESNGTVSVVTEGSGGLDVLFRQPGYAPPTWAGTANVNGQ